MKNYKRFAALILSFVCAAGLTACAEECRHNWTEANCYTPEICERCGTIGDEKTDHIWADATCVQPQLCTLCNAPNGEAKGHEWAEATCTAPEKCALCGETQGETAEHVWADADCENPQKCENCGTAQGKKAEHTYTETVLTEATSYREGRKLFTCDLCGDEYEEAYTLSPMTAKEIYDLALECVGEVEVKGWGFMSWGTGFLISSDGLVVTNYHVIEDYNSIKFKLGGVSYDVEEVVDYDSKIDLAVLKIRVSGRAYLETAPLGYEVGDKVYALGNPEGFNDSLTMGIISYADREVDGRTCIQHDASLTHGNSGGPLFNEFGRVIGVNTFGYEDSQNLNFAVAISELENLDLD